MLQRYLQFEFICIRDWNRQRNINDIAVVFLMMIIHFSPLMAIKGLGIDVNLFLAWIFIIDELKHTALTL